MAFPSSPANGQRASVNNIIYEYNDTKGAWLRVSAQGFTSANLTVGGIITDNYYRADGTSLLGVNKSVYNGTATASTSTTLIDSVPTAGNTSVTWSLTSKNINNSTYKNSVVSSLNDGTDVYYSEYGIILSNASVSVSTFTSNIVSGNLRLYAVGDSANVTITFQRTLLGSSTDVGYITAGASGAQGPEGNVNVSYGNTDVATYLTTYTGNIGNVKTTANVVTTGYFIGNASQLTGLPVSYGNTEVGAYLLTYTGNIGNLKTTSNVITTGYFIGNGSQLTGIDATSIQNGTSSVRAFSSGNVAVSVAGTSNVAVFTSTNIEIAGNLIPSANVTYNLGSSTRRWNVGYFAASTIDLGGSTIGAGENGFVMIPAGGSTMSFNSNGSMTGTLLTAAQTNITQVGQLANLTVDGNLTVNGNLIINGNTTTINANNLTVNDSIIYLAEENPADTLDIGITAHIVNPSLNHVGFVRDASDSTWKLFSNVATQPTTTVDFTGANYANLQVGNLIANNVGGTLTTASQTNITAVGNLTSLATSGTISAIGQVRANSNIASTSSTTGALTVIGGVGVSGNLNVGQFANISLGSVSADSALVITGNVSRGGAGYHDFLRVTSTAGGATNISKHFRLTSTGNLEIVNSAYSSVLLSLTDAGQLLISSSLAATSTTNGALTVAGGVGIGGNLFVGGALTESSSATLKENITPINGALDLILQLTGVIYDRQDGSRKNEAGLIAEEVNKVLPNLITLDDQGTPMGVQYTKLTAYLIEAVKSLKAEIDQLKKRD